MAYNMSTFVSITLIHHDCLLLVCISLSFFLQCLIQFQERHHRTMACVTGTTEHVIQK